MKIVCLFAMKSESIYHVYFSRDREMRGTATLAYEDFMGLAMGAHS